MTVCHHFSWNHMQLKWQILFSALSLEIGGLNGGESSRPEPGAKDVDLKLYQRERGLLENLSQSQRKLTCERPVPITASLAEGHHLAEIYCTITWGATVTVCKIKALRWNHRAAELYNQEPIWKYRYTPAFLKAPIALQTCSIKAIGYLTVASLLLFESKLFVIHFLFTTWQFWVRMQHQLEKHFLKKMQVTAVCHKQLIDLVLPY